MLDEPVRRCPTIDLTDTDGEPFSLADDTDKRAHARLLRLHPLPRHLPGGAQHLASALTRLDDADRDQVRGGVRDQRPGARHPEPILRSYLDRFDDVFIGLTGDLDTIVDGRPRPRRRHRPRTSPGRRTTTHGASASTSGDEAPVFWSQDTSPSQYADDIHTLLTLTA